jgi:Protein of unknown function (DUF2802)
MNGMGVNALFLGIIGVALLLSLLVFHLWRVSNQLRNEMKTVKVAMNAFGNDIAGLCLAEVYQDDKISDHGQLLQKLEQRIEDLSHQDQSSRSFHAAIAAARKGADVKVLTGEYGLTRDAAELLVRLHGFELG